jgi:CAAX prenyl protease-like protein
MANRHFSNLMQHPAFVRTAPFAAFMLFIALEEFLLYLDEQQLVNITETFRVWLYLPKMAVAGALLLLFRKHYVELVPRELLRLGHLLLSLTTGIVVFVLWINMDWTLTAQAPQQFDPNALHSGRGLIIALRCVGAVIVVPIMEELFWRSFLLRYLINSNFMAVTIGRLTWFSVLATCLLFGLEHHYIFAGIMAGLFFTLIYWRTKSISHCILCHGVANLCLAIYVLATAQWQFW